MKRFYGYATELVKDVMARGRQLGALVLPSDLRFLNCP